MLISDLSHFVCKPLGENIYDLNEEYFSKHHKNKTKTNTEDKIKD